MSHLDNSIQTSPQLQAGQFYGRIVGKRICSGVVLSELTHPTQRRLPEHSHQLAFFCLLLSGNYAEFLGRKTISYKPLTVVFHPPNSSHRDEVGRSGGHFFSVELESQWIDCLRDYATVPTTPKATETGDLTWLTLRLFREFRQPDACSELAVEGLLMAMLAEVTRQSTRSAEKQMPVWLRRAVELIYEDFRQNLTITGIATKVGVHPFHLSKVFRQFRKQSIGSFVNTLRVRYACDELQSLDQGLAEIALEAGFADQSHFTRVFKQITGTTPGVYRSLLKGK